MAASPVRARISANLLDRAIAEAIRLDSLAPIPDSDLPAVRVRACAMAQIISDAIETTPKMFRSHLSQSIVKALKGGTS